MLRLLFGTDEPVPATRVLQAGRMSVRLRGARLAGVFFDGVEVWHGIAFLHRDADWGTPEPVVQQCGCTEEPGGFMVRIQGHIPVGTGLPFEVTIEATEGVLRYAASCCAREDIATNRTGIVVMHPLSVCGRRVEVEHSDGRCSASTFPTLVAPWPPFMLVRAIRHEYAPGSWARCAFTGDDFELEDQRNNADASFKTYNRSNLMPRPYTLRAGRVLRQAVELHVESPPSQPVSAARGPVHVHIGALAGSLPLWGAAIASADVDAAAPVRQALRALAPPLLHLTLERPDEAVDWPGIARLLDEGGSRLRLDVGGLHADGAQAQLAPVAQALAASGVRLVAVAVFPSTPPVVDAARRAFPGCAVGGGTPHFFTQLNRIEDLGAVDFLCFTTASVVHGADDEEIMAGLQSLPAMLPTLQARHGPLPVQVGPSSIGARRSPLGGQPASDGSRRLALARRDPRTAGLYGAAWALGQLARFTAQGVQAVTLLGLQGDAALVPAGGTTPAYEVLRCLAASAEWRDVRVSQPEAIAVLSLQRPDSGATLLANLTDRAVDVALEGVSVQAARLMDAQALALHAEGAAASCWRTVALPGNLLHLPAYAVALVETLKHPPL